jgi:hypothetical protein
MIDSAGLTGDDAEVNRDLISMKTRQAFRENMVAWVLRQISDAFDAARIGCDLQYTPNVTGQRRTLVEQYYHTVDWTDATQVRQVLEVYETVLQRQESILQGISDNDGRYAREELKKLVWHLEKDGFKWVSGSIVASSGAPYLSEIKKAAVVFDARHLTDQIRRMEESVEKDPDLAIGTAKELVETTCKTILAARGKTIAGNPDMSTLTKETLKVLKLVPEGIPDAARGADVIKRVLSNLGAIGNGLSELRGLYGTGHGKHGAAVGLRARHARLAVGSAAILATFLFETHLDQPAPQSGSAPRGG